MHFRTYVPHYFRTYVPHYEPMVFGPQIVRILREAGWDTEPTPGVASPQWEGIILTVENPSQPPASATLLANQLTKYGFKVTVTHRQGAPKIKSLTGNRSL